MPLHPQAQAIVEQFAAEGGKPIEQMTPAEARMERGRNAAARAALAAPFRELSRVEDRAVPGPGGPVPVRVYWPSEGSRLPLLVYFHGGGWMFGNIESVDRTCRILAAGGRCVVVSVDYRLTPEHKFPAAAEDAYAVAAYAARRPEEFACDPSRIAVGGDSAGGNLAAVACLMAQDLGGPALAFQLLVYPLTDYDDNRPSMAEYAEGPLLTRAAIQYFWNHYVSSAEEGRHPYASPMNAARLEKLPPALVITAECDPLRDQGEAYARRLEQAGVPVMLKRYAGVMHVFFHMSGALDAGRAALADAAAALRNVFGVEERATGQ